MNKEEIISGMVEKGFLISPDVLDKLNNFNDELLVKLENFFKEEKPIVINQDLLNFLIKNEKEVEINWKEFENAKFLLEKGKDQRAYNVFLNLMDYNLSDKKKKVLNERLEELKKPDDILGENLKEEIEESPVIILKSYAENNKKKTVDTFVKHYRERYNALSKILQNRVELSDVLSIMRILNKSNRENVSLIGLIAEKRMTKNNNIMLTIEDISGSIKVLINNNKKELAEIGKDLVLDEAIGVTGVTGDKIVFANNIFLPDVQSGKKIKTCKDEVYAAFIADFHIGSSHFLEEDLLKFIKWLNGGVGSIKQRNIAKKIKYLFVAGDLVAGIGIYPGQEEDLVIGDIYLQYNKVAEYFSMIRKDVKIIVCGGNHDAMRIAEPQPLLNKDYAKAIWELPNVILVTNPSVINIHSSKNFEGFDVLMYHGFSFDYYGDNVETIRKGEPNSSDRAKLIIKFLLRRRHLSPTHKATLFVPTEDMDPLVIENVPDFFVCAHIHKASVGQYQHVTNICCSCWQSRIPFQVRVGHVPEPSRAVIVNLKNRDVKIMRFSSKDGNE